MYTYKILVLENETYVHRYSDKSCDYDIAVKIPNLASLSSVVRSLSKELNIFNAIKDIHISGLKRAEFDINENTGICITLNMIFSNKNGRPCRTHIVTLECDYVDTKHSIDYCEKLLSIRNLKNNI